MYQVAAGGPNRKFRLKPSTHDFSTVSNAPTAETNRSFSVLSKRRRLDAVPQGAAKGVPNMVAVRNLLHSSRGLLNLSVPRTAKK